MRSIILAYCALNAALFTFVPAQAAHHKTKKQAYRVALAASPKRQAASNQTFAQLHHCDWVGAGGRAVYRCNLIDFSENSKVAFEDRWPRRICDWVGPGARAVYVCRYY